MGVRLPTITTSMVAVQVVQQRVLTIAEATLPTTMTSMVVTLDQAITGNKTAYVRFSGTAWGWWLDASSRPCVRTMAQWVWCLFLGAEKKGTCVSHDKQAPQPK